VPRSWSACAPAPAVHLTAQNSADRLIGDVISQIGERPDNPVIAPGIDFPWPSAQSIPRLLCRLAVGPNVGVRVRAHLRGWPVAAADTQGTRWRVRAHNRRVPIGITVGMRPQRRGLFCSLSAPSANAPRDRHRDPMTEPAGFLSVLLHAADEGAEDPTLRSARPAMYVRGHLLG
jgi:hypothetical protein